MKALILIAAGLMSSGAIAQMDNSMSPMNSMGSTTGSVTHDMKTTTRHTGTVTHTGTMMHHRTNHMAMRHGCTMRMRHGHKVRVCSSHTMHPMHHHATMMHKKVVVETKTKM